MCHLPPGTSKWNKIEHRLFSHISMNWRSRPLTSHDIIVKSIAATTTSTGLSVHAELDTHTYPIGVKIPDAQMNALHDSGVLQKPTGLFGVGQGSDLSLTVKCFDQAGYQDDDPIEYAVALSLWVAPSIGVDVYTQVRDQIQVQIRPRPAG